MGELVKIADQMGLIIVTTFNRNGGPRCIALLNRAEHLLKADYPCEELWSKPDLSQETPLQLAAADSGIVRELVH